ncbi:phosphoserine phosphatase [Schizosaccharomyces octosporus yFS286]|uniref:phosphoserine phosphatase n=1 Tax=Schizosaccharomyces octosporus (strain yFS286) TaxID=483514 RepID=S9Q1P4_SCHOY|nr:phosphoserine phosphatase [Schizosaccharomyces octosporus yFS286]EPX74047.1 phosphoserine phosphatase [Schizosaccharomyces octosporus yFS286]
MSQAVVVLSPSSETKALEAVFRLFESPQLQELGDGWKQVSGKLVSSFADAKAECDSISSQEKLDCNCLKYEAYSTSKKLVVFDMDSTLIQQECIDEIAAEAGIQKEVSTITSLAMNGEIDFQESLRRRVSLLEGLSVDVIDKIIAKITFTPGAKELCRVLKKLGATLVVASGGFIPMANYVKEQLNLDYAYANMLEYSHDGKYLNGKVQGAIVDGKRKAEILREKKAELGLEEFETMAVGDGANDLIMMGESGLGVAYNAKPKVQLMASSKINQTSLQNVLYLLGINKSEQERLLA